MASLIGNVGTSGSFVLSILSINVKLDCVANTKYHFFFIPLSNANATTSVGRAQVSLSFVLFAPAIRRYSMHKSVHEQCALSTKSIVYLLVIAKKK